MCLKNNTENKGEIVRWGRVIYQNIKTGRTTNCINYLPKSKFLSNEEIRPFRR